LGELIMPWAAAAGLALGSYGTYKSSKDRPDAPDPYEQARANFQTNNINRFTPFGSVKYHIDNNGTANNLSDDTYAMQQQYSPEMQGLLDVMMGRAGATPARFESQMPDGLRSMMSERFGSDVPRSTVTEPQFAFGYDGGPAQAREPEVQDLGFQTEYETTPGQTTNQELVSQAYRLGNLSDADYDWFQQNFNESGVGGDTNWSGTPLPNLLNQLGNDGPLNADNRRRFEALFGSLPEVQVSERTSPDQPSAQNYDMQAIEALLQALSETGGVQ
jgi:hypothetical protein